MHVIVVLLIVAKLFFDIRFRQSTMQTITPQALYAQLGLANSPIVIDVRKTPAYDQSPRILPGSWRIAPEHLANQLGRLPKNKPYVMVCVHGHEVSKTAAKQLQLNAFNAVYLEGGLEAWMAAGLPTIAKQQGFMLHDGSRWVTRARPKIDRLACPWLIKRFIDPHAVFYYVPAEQVLARAQELGGQAFDVPSAANFPPVRFTHRGEQCSFDAFIADFDIHDAPLNKLASIVRAADTDTLHTSPQAAGLLAISIGLSANYADDNLLLQAAMPLYDALYAWCKNGQNETHNAAIFQSTL